MIVILLGEPITYDSYNYEIEHLNNSEHDAIHDRIEVIR